MERKAPAFFASPSELRAWFEQNHQTTQELWIGFYKTSSGQPSITWPESVDQALCFGWIDGVRKSIDDISYSIRFTPLKPHSIWSSVTIKRAPAYENHLRPHKKAWEYFKSRPPSYKQPAIFWVMSAMQEGTRLKRLAFLIECPEQGRTIPPLTRPSRSK